MAPTSDTDNIFLMLGRMEGKQDALLSKLDSMDRRLDGHGARLKTLEDASATRKGVVYAVRFAWVGLGASLAYVKDILTFTGTHP
jgi:hypothetical protein